ncbi:MAG: alpha/beta fold hydrolase [Nitrososphaerales archaeon]
MPISIVADKTRIYYELTGNGEECIVFVSGTGFNSEVWKPFQVPYFSKNYKVLICDNRGVGNSDKPDAPYSTRVFASDIVQVMKNLGIERGHLIGHSMGGRVAQWMALDHPERVDKLVLAATGSGNFSNKTDYIRGIPLDTALEIAEMGYLAYMRKHVESEFFFNPNFARKDPIKYRIAVDSHLKNVTPLKPYLRHVIARQMHETSNLISKIGSKTLVLVGEADKISLGTGSHYEASRFLEENIPNASLESVPAARHAFFWEKPEESNKITLNFLRAA